MMYYALDIVEQTGKGGHSRKYEDYPLHTDTVVEVFTSCSLALICTKTARRCASEE